MTDTVPLAAPPLSFVAAVVVFATRLLARMRGPAAALFPTSAVSAASAGRQHDTIHPGEFR